MSHVVKRLSPAHLDAAIARAAHYRAPNQPEEAESICRDVLDVDGANQTAWKLLGLAMTDRFSGGEARLLARASRRVPVPPTRGLRSEIDASS